MRVCAFNGPAFTDLSVSTGVGSEGEKTGGERRVWERKRGGEVRRGDMDRKKKNTKSDKGERK